MTASNTYGRQVVVPLTNKSGGGVIAGDVVYLSDGTNADSFTTGTTSAYTGGIGIAQETIANNATGRILVSGYAALVNVNASVTIKHYGATYTVAKQATDAGASRGAGTFCQFLTGGTTPDATIWQPDLGAGSGFTPVIGYATVQTDETTTSATFTDLATSGPATTVTVNTKVKVTLSADLYANSAGTSMLMSVALSSGNTVAAADNQSLRYVAYDGTNNDGQASRVLYISGLTPGSTVFTAKYRRGSGTGTAHARFREILVETLD